MSRRRQHLPWRAAGTASEHQRTAADVVRERGWVFDSHSSAPSLAAFVASGDRETEAFIRGFHLDDDPALPLTEQTVVEVGAGIGRMSASLTRSFGRVVACDLDPAFLERCRETVAQFGRVDRLQTSQVSDGRTLSLPESSADMVFSYLTLQHCHRGDALALVAESLRVVRPGGRIVLNFRTWLPRDIVLWPLGKLVRATWHLPRIGQAVADHRLAARLGWQANRLSPSEVLAIVGSSINGVVVYRSPKRRPFHLPTATEATFDGVHRAHWWLVAHRVD